MSNPPKKDAIAALQERLKIKFMPVAKFLRKKNLKFKHARVGDGRIEYFRINELELIVKVNE